jgi:SNF family Na+-dependent transporter
MTLLMQLAGSAYLILFALVCLILAVCLYFLPWVIAHRRAHRAVDGILLLDLLLGWTVVGWLIALACTSFVPAIESRELT